MRFKTAGHALDCINCRRGEGPFGGMGRGDVGLLRWRPLPGLSILGRYHELPHLSCEIEISKKIHHENPYFVGTALSSTRMTDWPTQNQDAPDICGSASSLSSV